MFRYKYNKFKNVTHKQKRKKGEGLSKLPLWQPSQYRYLSNGHQW